MLLKTDKTCEQATRQTRMRPCGGPLTWAVAQVGTSEGRWIECCFRCGAERVLTDEEAVEAQGKAAEIETERAKGR